MFRVECECGAMVAVEARRGRCPHCGFVLEIVWPQEGVRPGTILNQLRPEIDEEQLQRQAYEYELTKPLTISEKYDDDEDKA